MPAKSNPGRGRTMVGDATAMFYLVHGVVKVTYNFTHVTVHMQNPHSSYEFEVGTDGTISTVAIEQFLTTVGKVDA